MRRRLTRTACALAIALSLSASAAAAPFTLSLLPAGAISGLAGSTIGWGYSISNPSATAWLVLTSLDSDPFVHATPTVLFDFPILAPLASATVLFEEVLGLGLMMLQWDGAAPVGFTNTGVFTLTGEFWSDDPLGGGSFVEAADDQTADYSASVVGGVVPEPATILLLATAVTLVRRRRRH